MPKITIKDAAGVEREFEIGMDEAFKVFNASVWPANVKRTYDEYQDLGLKSGRSHGKIADRICQDSENHSEELRKVSVMLLKNMVENNDLNMKQHLERINMHNMNTAENTNQQNDTLFALLVEALKEDGEATVTISRPKKKA